MELRKHPISGYLVNRDGSYIENPVTGFKLTPTLAPSGYLKIGTYICSSGTVHQLVYESWVGLRPEGLQINHMDGCKTNNDYTNLEVVTQQQNTIHAYSTGLAKGKKGSTNSQAKLSEEDMGGVVNMLDEGRCNSCIAERYGLHDRYVSLIRSGKRWGHLVTSSYPRSNKWVCKCGFATTIETTPDGGRE